MTSFNKYIDLISNKDKLSELEIVILKERLDGALSLLVEFHNIHSELQMTCDEDDLNEHESERENFEEKFYTLTGTAKIILKKHVDSEGSEGSKVESASVFSNRCESSGVKLPEI